MSFKTVRVVHPYPFDSLGKYHDFKLHIGENNEMLINYQGKYWELEEEPDIERGNVFYSEPTYKVKNYSMPIISRFGHWGMMAFLWTLGLLMTWNIIDWMFYGGEISKLGAFFVLGAIVFLIGSNNDS